MPRNKTEDSNKKYTCCVCKKPFDSLSEFNKSYSSFYAATERLPLCKSCLAKIFNDYSVEYGSQKKAMKRICMAFDLYYNDSIFEKCNDGSDTVIGNYIKKLNMVQYRDRTFDTTLKEGFYFEEPEDSKKQKKAIEENEPQIISSEDETKWGNGFDYEDYEILNSHFKELTDANPQYDSNQAIFINDLCYIKMQQMKALREGRIDDYIKLTDSYRKSFEKAGLKTVRETNVNEEFTIGVNAEIIEKYTPAEYYKSKQLYKDFDHIGEYIERFLLRPLKNLMFGSKDRDTEFYVKEEDSEGDTDEEFTDEE